MGSTSVNDVGSLLGGLNSSMQAQMMNKISSVTSNDASSNSPSFESILNAGITGDRGTDLVSEIGSNAANKPGFDQKNNSDRIAGEDKREAGKTSRTDEKQDKVKSEKNEKISDSNKSEKSNEVADEETLERAEEVLLTAAAALLERVQDILQISPEEAANLLDEMGMSAEDLLNSENLSAFALQAMGAEDSLALLTDESKYEQFQNIAEALNELLESDSNIDGMSIEELRDLAESIKQTQNSETGSTVEIQSDENGDTVNANVNTEAIVKKDRENGTDNGNESNNAHSGAEGFTPNPGTVAPVVISESNAPASTADAQQIADQILDYIKSSVKPDSQTLEMQLHPASLGNVQISLTNKGGNISASFIAQNEQVRAVLETQMIQLQQRFEEQGIKVTSIEVSVNTNSFSENLEQQGHREEEQEANRPRRVRRLQITPGMDIPEVLDEEEKLAAEMLEASGGTMDLQA